MDELTNVQSESDGPEDQENDGSNEKHALILSWAAGGPPMLSSAAAVQKMNHDDDKGDDEQNVDESARDAKSESAHPEEQKSTGNDEEHAVKSEWLR